MEAITINTHTPYALYESGVSSIQNNMVERHLNINENGRIFLGWKVSHNFPTTGNIIVDTKTENIIMFIYMFFASLSFFKYLLFTNV